MRGAAPSTVCNDRSASPSLHLGQTEPFEPFFLFSFSFFFGVLILSMSKLFRKGGTDGVTEYGVRSIVRLTLSLSLSDFGYGVPTYLPRYCIVLYIYLGILYLPTHGGKRKKKKDTYDTIQYKKRMANTFS